VLRKQNPVKASAADTRGAITPYDIFERAQERREQRKLRRLSLSDIQNSSGTKSPRNLLKRPPYTLEDITNRLNAPNKLTRRYSNYTLPNARHQPNAGTPLMASAGSRHTSSTFPEPRTPYSESRGELQRQFAISQRLLRKHQPGSPNPAEVGAYLGGLERLHAEDGWVDGFRLDVEKPLQRVSAQRLQRGSRLSMMPPERPKKVRFAPVVECIEF